MTTTIYARVPLELKVRVEEYAVKHAMTLTGAVSTLLKMALDSVDELSSIETRVLFIEHILEIKR